MGEQIRYISLFSGVEACSVAWYHMDNWLPQVFAEFDEFPSAVLKHQFPHVPNVGDVTKHDWKQYKGQIELIVGGSPCQSFSVAGKRLGLDDPRGNLALHFLRIVEEIRPTWFLFENVVGLLSSDDGRDFAAFLREVENIGYGCAYRVLDAQYFGVPQRRRRVFVVGHIDGDWRRAGAVLFEPEGLSGNPPSREAKKQEAATNAGSSVGSRGRYWDGRGIAQTITAKGFEQRMPDKGHFQGVVVPDVTGTLDTETNAKFTTQAAQAGFLIPTQHPDEVSPTVTAKWAKGADTVPGQKIDNGNMVPIGIDLFNQEETGDVHCALRTAQGHGAPAVMYENHGMDSRVKEVEVAPTIPARAGTGGNNLPIITQPSKDICFDHTFGQNAVVYEDVAPTLKANGLVPTSPAVLPEHTELAVRRLTPLECERLQGFPDDWTKIPWKGKPIERCPDGPRFKAMGNSMAVPVMRWIGEGIEMVNRIPRTGEVPQQEELGWL